MSFKDRALAALFTTYKRTLSPVLHSFGVGDCIFLPTCSDYAHEALQRHGLIRGTALALARIARCHPWGKPGHDPVP